MTNVAQLIYGVGFSERQGATFERRIPRYSPITGDRVADEVEHIDTIEIDGKPIIYPNDSSSEPLGVWGRCYYPGNTAEVFGILYMAVHEGSSQDDAIWPISLDDMKDKQSEFDSRIGQYIDIAKYPVKWYLSAPQ